MFAAAQYDRVKSVRQTEIESKQQLLDEYTTKISIIFDENSSLRFNSRTHGETAASHSRMRANNARIKALSDAMLKLSRELDQLRKS